MYVKARCDDECHQPRTIIWRNQVDDRGYRSRTGRKTSQSNAIGIGVAWYDTVPSMSLFLGQEGG